MKNRKRIWIIVSILIIVGTLFATIGLFMGEGNGFYYNNTGIHIIKHDIHEEKQLELEEIKNIDMNVEDLNIIFEQADTYGIEIKKFIDDEQIDWELKDGVLKVKKELKSKFRIFSFDLGVLNQSNIPYIKVYLPKEAQLEKILLSAKNRNIQVSNVNTKDLLIENEYGNIIVEKLKTINTRIETKEGDIFVKGDFIGNTQIQSSYGEIKIEANKEKSYYNLDINTKYGKIILDEAKLEERSINPKNEGKTFKVVTKEGNIVINFGKNDIM